MRPCNHSAWLSISSAKTGSSLLRTDRVERLLAEDPSSHDRKCGLILLLGKKERTRVIRKNFGFKSDPLWSYDKRGQVHLHLDQATSSDERLVLVAEGDLTPQRYVGAPDTEPTQGGQSGLDRSDDSDDVCHEVHSHLVPWASDNATASITDKLYYNVVLPLTSVVCFFADDLGGTGAVVRFLRGWLVTQSTNNCRSTLRVVLVAGRSKCDNTTSVQDALLEQLGQLGVGNETVRDRIQLECFTPQRGRKADDCYPGLKPRLMASLETSMEALQRSRLVFSARHFNKLVRTACSRLSSSPVPAGFVESSRIDNPVAGDLSDHIRSFIKLAPTGEHVLSFSAVMIASSLVLDNYPPENHIFHPRAVMEALYETSILEAVPIGSLSFEQDQNILLRTGLLNQVQKRFVSYFEQMLSGSQSALDVHKHNLAQGSSVWSVTFSSSTCLCCIRRTPEYKLHCGHMLCAQCVENFGQPYHPDRYVYVMSCCPLCQESMPPIHVRRVPPTAGCGVIRIYRRSAPAEIESLVH